MPQHTDGLPSYQPRKVNGDADGLSRMPLDMEQYMCTCSQQIEPDVISTVTQALQLESHEREPFMCPASVTSACTFVEQERITSPVAKISREQLKKAQEDDPVISKVQEYVMTAQWP